MGSPHTCSLFSDISGQVTAAGNSSSGASRGGPSSGTSSGSKKSSATTVRVLSSGTLWTLVLFSVLIDAMMNHGFQQTNSDTVSPDGPVAHSLPFKLDFCGETLAIYELCCCNFPGARPGSRLKHTLIMPVAPLSFLVVFIGLLLSFSTPLVPFLR